MKRTWTGLLVLAGVLVMSASDVAAAQAPPQAPPQPVLDLEADLRKLGFEVELVVAPEDARPASGGPRASIPSPGSPSLGEVRNADDASGLIAEVCNCVAGLGTELAAIMLRAPGGWRVRLALSMGTSVAADVCSLIGDLSPGNR